MEILTIEQEDKLVEAICLAEKKTSGEIRIHIEKYKAQNHIKRAEDVFFAIDMQKTKNRNGVLFYVNVQEKKFVVLGDEGINQKVPEDFWKEISLEVIEEFKIGKYFEGLKKGVLLAAEKLSEYFPYDKENDIDELPNTISRKI